MAKKKVTQENIDWNVKFLNEEWDYCISMINWYKEQANQFTLDNYHNNLSHQHLLMGAIRHLFKVPYLMKNRDKSSTEAIESAISNLHSVLELIEEKI